MDYVDPRCPITPDYLKGVKPMCSKESKESKTKEERIAEMYIKEIISETMYYKMLNRIRKNK